MRRIPTTSPACMMIAALLGGIPLAAPPPAAAQTATTNGEQPGLDGERALLGKVAGIPLASPSGQQDTAPPLDGARALLGSSAPSVTARTSAAARRSGGAS